MKLTVIHDREGNIKAALASPDDGASVQTDLGPGESLTELAGPAIDIHDAEAVTKHLEELVEGYRLESEEGTANLVRRA